MKKFKISIVCIALSLALTISFICIKQANSKNDTFQNDSAYMTAVNLALNKCENKFRKLTDGDISTCFKGSAGSGNAIDIDLGEIKPFNCIVLKENGLNIKDFSVLVSEDNEAFRQIYHGDKIEYHRLCTFDEVSARYIRIFVNESDTAFKLKEIEVYNQPMVERNDFRTIAYVLNSDFQSILNNDEISDKDSAIKEMLESYNFSGITNVQFYCGISFDENGSVFVGDPNGDMQKQKEELRYMVNCMRKFGRENLKISFVIPNGSGNPATNIAMSDNKAVFIENLISLSNELGFDGIDFDYEFPQSDYDFKVFGDFLAELKKHMINEMNVKDNAELSCAFGTRDINYPQEVIDAIDVVNMMTYDIFDQDGQHSSFWSCAVQGAKYLESLGFSKQQINIGIPFYGTQVDALMEQYIYKNLPSLDYFENTYTCNSYLDGSPTQVYFNSPALARDKTAYAMLNGYGGIMVWHFSCDTEFSSENSLWRAVYTAEEQFGGAKQ